MALAVCYLKTLAEPHKWGHEFKRAFNPGVNAWRSGKNRVNSHSMVRMFL